MKSKNRILENPKTTIVIVVSVISFIVGIFAVGILFSLIVVGIIDIIYFRTSIIKLFQSIRKKIPKKKEKATALKKEEKPIYEYKVGDEIVTTKDGSMKKKDNHKKKANKEKKEKKKKKIGWKIFQWFLLFCCVCFIAGIIAVIAFFSYIVKNAPEFIPENLYSIEPSTIYDINGELLTTVGTKNRKIITYDELPEVFINALIATEDSQFFQHNGVDLSRFLVASIKQVLGDHNAGGASTLTMQLSKNYIVKDDTAKGIDGIIRKFTDMYIAVFKIEPTYTKEEIIEFYVNSGQLGSRWGVEAASQLYFNKSAKDMNISEAALLAGMYQSPSGYNPFYYPEKAEARRKTVLYLMHRHQYITDEEYEIALKLTVDKIVVDKDKANVSAEEMDDTLRSAIDVVVAEVEDLTGYNPRLVSMKIYTTIDKNIQKHVGNIMSGNSYKWENSKVQAGVAVVDVKTGAIVAIGGNRDNTQDGLLNHATQIKRQIGSTAKPLYDYGPAIEYLNWSTGNIVADEKITYTDGSSINNWDGKFNGFQTIRTQLKLSRNIPALKTFQQVDKNKVYNFVTSLGLSPDKSMFESHSIGGYYGENPLSMASAYAAFGNGGYYTKPYSVTKIVYNQSGDSEIIQTDTKQVMSSSTAYMVTNMLQDTATYAIDGGRYGQVNGVRYAGKTGTTNYDAATKKQFKFPANAVNDYWAVGYNTDYSIAIWYGYDNNNDGYNKLSSMQHTKFFQAVAKGIFKNKADFTMPNTVKKVTVEKDSATLMLPSEFTPKSYTTEELFVAGTEPTAVSTRFSKLPDVSNISATASNGIITLSWNPIQTPDAFNAEYLKKINKSAYSKEEALDKYVNDLIGTNQKVLGTVGYNIYVQTDSGLNLIGWTPDTNYQITGQYGNVTIVIKSCYSVFKDNMSNGKSVTVSAGNAPTPPPAG